MFKLHHIALSVSDIAKSVTFYELFNFTRVGEWTPEDHSFIIVNLRNGEVMLELFCYRESQPLPESAEDLDRDLPVIGVKHFALGVESIDEAKAKLQYAGFEILNEDFNEDRSGANYFFIKDPDGMMVEVIEDNRGY